MKYLFFLLQNKYNSLIPVENILNKFEVIVPTIGYSSNLNLFLLNKILNLSFINKKISTERI